MAKWLKLDSSIFDDEKIKLIRQMPEGDALFTLWIGLLCLAMKKETDALYIANDVPYNPETLSTIYGLPGDTIRLGLTAFSKFGMIELQEDGAIYITHLRDYQPLEKLDRNRILTAERMRRYRERLVSGGVCRNSVTVTPTEEEEEEEEEEKSIVELKPDKAPLPVAATTRKVIDYLNKKAGKHNDTEAAGNRAKIKALLNAGYTEEQMKKVIVIKSIQWAGDAKMNQYLRPSTLFAPGHFADYVAEYEEANANAEE